MVYFKKKEKQTRSSEESETVRDYNCKKCFYSSKQSILSGYSGDYQ